MEIFFDSVIYFMLFSFCGWICESVFCSILEKRLVNRGFLSGPLCPVYGFGGLITVWLPNSVKEDWVLLFICGMAACTALEYAASWALEKLFNTKWWDYSDLKFNINGRVCLHFSLVFGLLSVVAVKLIYPPLYALGGRLPGLAKGWLAGGMLTLFAIDCFATVYSIIQLNGKLAELKIYMDELRQRLGAISGYMPLTQMIEQFKADTSGKYESARQSIQQLLGKFEGLTSIHKLQHIRIIRAFPNMKSLKYQEQFKRLRESVLRLSNKIRKN